MATVMFHLAIPINLCRCGLQNNDSNTNCSRKVMKKRHSYLMNAFDSSTMWGSIGSTLDRTHGHGAGKVMEIKHRPIADPEYRPTARRVHCPRLAVGGAHDDRILAPPRWRRSRRRRLQPHIHSKLAANTSIAVVARRLMTPLLFN